ncbi:hypothetical protein BJ165DRAFT_1469417, partial [Panaeolus papilionaceus]
NHIPLLGSHVFFIPSICCRSSHHLIAHIAIIFVFFAFDLCYHDLLRYFLLFVPPLFYPVLVPV